MDNSDEGVADGTRKLFELLAGDEIASLIKRDGAAYVSYGFAMNTVHLAAAVRTLHAADMTYATAPLRRSMLEFGVYMRWLAAEPDEALDTLNRQLQANQGKLFQRAKDAGVSVAKDVNAIVRSTIGDTRVPKNKKPPNSESLLRKYGDTKALAIWTAESRLAHPTLTAAQCFVVDKGETIELHQSPVLPTNPSMVIPSFCLLVLYDAACFLNVWLTGGPWTATLAEIAAKQGFDVYPAQQRA